MSNLFNRIKSLLSGGEKHERDANSRNRVQSQRDASASAPSRAEQEPPQELDAQEEEAFNLTLAQTRETLDSKRLAPDQNLQTIVQESDACQEQKEVCANLQTKAELDLTAEPQTNASQDVDAPQEAQTQSTSENVVAYDQTPTENDETILQCDLLEEYDYELPERLIAQEPTAERDHARLMIVDRAANKISQCRFYDVVKYLRPNDVMVLNDTKVLPARLKGRREQTDGRWEGLFLQQDPKTRLWEIMSKTRGYLRPGEQLVLNNPRGGGLERRLEVVGRTERKTLVVRPLMEENETSLDFLNYVGWVPIPPYIRSGLMTDADRNDYQTVYARRPGAVAAPTAGLHFTPELLRDIKNMGVALCSVTLHVGIGTFKPITVNNIAEHQMHSEYAEISEETVKRILERKAMGGRLIAIGTTSVRTLESASNVMPDGTIDSTGHNPYTLQPFAGQTNLFIRPPYRFKTVDAMLTNFHLPKSTLIIMTRTFGGDELIKRAYQMAIDDDFRFYSYGDAMLIL